jgi:hypothetical protein
MANDKLIGTPDASEAKGSTDNGRRPETVNLVEMGSVLKETKGMIRGLEYNLTPRSG